VPIRWSAVKVQEAVDQIDFYIDQATAPLENAKAVAEAARKIPNLPQYIEDCFVRLLGEIERSIGGGMFDESGRLLGCTERIRDRMPDGAIKDEQAKLRHGSQQSLV